MRRIGDHEEAACRSCGRAIPFGNVMDGFCALCWPRLLGQSAAIRDAKRAVLGRRVFGLSMAETDAAVKEGRT